MANTDGKLLVQFGRGSESYYKNNWEASLEDYIFFTTDNHKLYLNGEAFGGDSSCFLNVEYTAPNTLTFTDVDGNTTEINFQTAQAGDSAEESLGGMISAEDIYKLYNLGDEVETIETTIEEIQEKLEELESSIKPVVCNDGSIEVNETDTEQEINVVLNESDTNIITNNGNGLYASVKVVTTSSDDDTVAKSYKVVGIDADGNEIDLGGETIDVLKDQFLKSVEVGTIPDGEDGAGDSALIFTFITSDGEEQVVYMDINTNIWDAETGAGLTYNEETQKVEVKIDSNSESYITVGDDGVLVSGIDDAIKEATEAVSVEINLEDETTHITLDSVEDADTGKTTYTIGENDIASDEELQDTIERVSTLEDLLTWQEFE